MHLLSYIIPVYNNSETLTDLMSRIVSLSSDVLNVNYEIIFVNDGSTDESEKLIKELNEQNSLIKYIIFQRNFGQVAAIKAGLEVAKGDAVVVVSADMQEPIELVASMYKKWMAGTQLVLAYRANRNDGIINNLTSKFFYGLIKLSLPEMPQGGFDYCLFDRNVLDYMNSLNYRNSFLQGDVLYAGFETVIIPYTRVQSSKPKNNSGINNFSFKLKYFTDGILHTGTYPIRFISLLGLFTTLSGLIYSVVIIINWFLGLTPFRGWAPIMISVLVIGGLILFTLGVLGEYIWRIYDQLRGMPQFIIKEKNTD